MCGIVGILGKMDEPAIKRMTDSIAHRGPDDEGSFVHNGISLGFRRLSIIDLSRLGHQPMCTKDKKVWIVFNGEVYNFRSLRTQLEERGYAFLSRTDTEVILNAYQEWGVDCLEHLSGMFAFAIWDENKKRLVLARDRLGIKPLYYFRNGRMLIFASEVRAFHASGYLLKEVSERGLFQYLSFGAASQPDTIFSGIQMLPGGCVIEASSSSFDLRRYWEVPYGTQRQPKAAMHDYVGELEELLLDSTRKHMISDVAVGAFLSGGVDSSLIVSMMQEAGGVTPKSYSIGFDVGKERFDETRFAEKVAGMFGTDHRSFTLTADDLLATMPNFAASIDQPTGDAINTFFVSKFARADVTVALSGLGGDELFGGYTHYQKLIRFDKYLRYYRMMPSGVRKATIKILTNATRANGEYSLIGRAEKYLSNAHSLAALYKANSRVMQEKEILSILGYPEGVGSDWSPNSYPFDINGNAERLNALSFWDVRTFMTNILLRDTDAASMAHSLEVRVPLIDHRIVEHAFSLPLEMRVNPKHGTKKILRQLLKRRGVPDEIADRPKAGFSFPLEIWMRNGLREDVRFRLLERLPEQFPKWNHRFIKQMISRFYSEQFFPYQKIWLLYVFSYWHEMVVESKG